MDFWWISNEFLMDVYDPLSKKQGLNEVVANTVLFQSIIRYIQLTQLPNCIYYFYGVCTSEPSDIWYVEP